MNWKRMLALGMLSVLLMTDQSIVYAAENRTRDEVPDETVIEMTDVEELGTDEEPDPNENATDNEGAGTEEGSGEAGGTEEKPDEELPPETETPDHEEASGGENPDTENPSGGETSENPPEDEPQLPDSGAGEGEISGTEPADGEPGTELPDKEPETGADTQPGNGETPEGGQDTDITGEQVQNPQEPAAALQPAAISGITVSEIPAQYYTGSEIRPAITLTDNQGTVLTEGTHYTAAYRNNVNVGEAAVLITGIEANGYTGTLEKTYTILPYELSFGELVWDGLEEEYPYTGKNVKPEFSLLARGVPLQKDVDYTCGYSNNKEIGTASITVKGLGNYTGTAEKTFAIAKRRMSSDLIKVSFKDGKSSYTYTGKAIKPKVTVKYDGKTLKEKTDYTVSYSNNKKAGTAKVKITGKGIYSGSCTKSFKIKPVSVSKLKIAKFSTCSYLKTGSIDTKVKFGSQTLKKGRDYTITFKNKVKTGKNTVVIKGKGNFSGSKSMTVKVTFSDKDKVSLKSCTISSWDAAEKKLTVQLEAGSMSKLKKLNSTFYIVQYDSLGKTVRKRVKASVKGNYMRGELKVTDGGKAAMMSKYALAVKLGNKYQVISKSLSFLSNPEKTATMTEPYNGYYEADGKVTSKKGIQGASEDYLEDLGAQHVLLNMDIADLVSTKKKSGYVAYKYNGKTYYFQDMIAWVQTLRYLNGWDNDNPYGWHRRSVTVVLLLSYKSELSYLIHPSARKKGAAPYYALNMKEKKARETFEALFCYLGEQLGDNKKSRVCNWTLGNEVNCCEAWNYSGGLPLDECVENYAEAFQLLYQGIRRTASTSRVFISLDHSWGASTEGHSGKAYLDEFASYMNKTAPKMQWNVNYHPYSQPLTRNDFWNDGSNTTGSKNTPYISMKNIKVLTDYLTKIESKYKKKKGSIRVILGEQGFSAVKGKTSAEKTQAAALGYGYYIAAFNSRVDAYIIRTYLDDPAETRGGLYLGLMSASHKKKQAYNVYKFIDTEQSAEYMKKYLSTVGISSWKKKIPNFDAGKLNAGDF